MSPCCSKTLFPVCLAERLDLPAAVPGQLKQHGRIACLSLLGSSMRGALPSATALLVEDLQSVYEGEGEGEGERQGRERESERASERASELEREMGRGGEGGRGGGIETETEAKRQRDRERET